MMRWLKSLHWSRWIEAAFVVVILVSVVQTLRHLQIYGLLPQPYFLDTNDTFMDWFNVANWAHSPGAYDTYRSVYPPLVFVVVKLLSPWSCNIFDKIYSRSCDTFFPWEMGLFFVTNGVLAFLCFRKNDRSTALMRTLALMFGLPMLFGVERGQLAIPTMIVFILGYGNLLKSARWKWLNIALAVNSKPYLILTLIPQFLRRRWVMIECCGVAIVTIYLFTFGVKGEGSLMDIFRNIAMFTDVPVIMTFQSAFYQPSYVGVVNALKTTFPFMFYLGSEPVDAMLFWFPAATMTGIVGVVLCFLLAALRPFAVPVRRLTALSILLVLTTTLAGGYTQIFLFFLVFFEPWRGPARIAALVCVYLLSISTDIPLIVIGHGLEQSYLSGRLVTWNVGVNLGELVRPGLILVIEYSLVAQTLWDIWRARGSVAAPRPAAIAQPA